MDSSRSRTSRGSTAVFRFNSDTGGHHSARLRGKAGTVRRSLHPECFRPAMKPQPLSGGMARYLYSPAGLIDNTPLLLIDRNLLVEYGKRRKWSSSEAMPGWITIRVLVLMALFFASNRPAERIVTVKESMHIWVADRQGSEWNSPWPVENLNSESEDGTPTVALDGVLYFVSDRQAEPNKNSIYEREVIDGKLWLRFVCHRPSIRARLIQARFFHRTVTSPVLLHPIRWRGRRGSLCLT